MSTPRCFDCGEELGGYTAVDEGDTPTAGAVSVCLYCGAAALFTGNGLEIREPTDSERAELDQHPQIVEVRRRCQQVRDALAGKPVLLNSMTLPCGCRLAQVFVDGDKSLLVEECSETCLNLADVITEGRKQGKPVALRPGSITSYLAERGAGERAS